MLYAAIKPLVKSRVEVLAKDATIRRAIFAELVKLRLEQSVSASKVSPDAAPGMAQRICEELAAMLDFAQVDPTSEELRQHIARVVTVKVV